MYIILFLIAFAIGLACYVFILHNKIMPHKQVADERWLYIDALLKRRLQVTHHLLLAAKGQMQHEAQVTEALNKIRSHTRRYGTDLRHMHNRIEAEFELLEALKQLVQAAEKYPDLQSNADFLNYQKMLTGLEEELNKKSDEYNQSVTEINKLMNNVSSKYIVCFFEVEKYPPFKAIDS